MIFAPPPPPTPLATLQAAPTFVDASLYFQEELLDARFIDLDGDGRLELVVSVLDRARKERELRIHRFDAEGRVTPTAERVYAVLDDVVAWTAADVRPDPGRELCLITPGGAFSLSPTQSGLRENIERLVRADLFYTVPSARELPWWPYALEGEDAARLLLPTADTLVIWARAPKDASEMDGGAPRDPREPSYVLETALVASGAAEAAPSGDPSDRVSVGKGGVRMSFEASYGRGFLLAERDVLGDELFDVGASLAAPALADVNGDGRLDLLVPRGQSLDIHVARGDGGGYPAQPSRSETMPSSLWGGLESGDWRLADVDGDGDADLVVLKQEEGGDPLENHEWRVMLFVNDGGRLMSEQPSALLRFHGSQVSVRLADLDGDGRLDLFVREVVLPSGLAMATGFRFSLTTLLFRGEPGGFERRPVLKQTREYDEASLTSAIAQRVLRLDLSGDGIADLVEIDLRGRIAIRRVLREKRMFGGTSWTLEEEPWKRFDVRGRILGLRVEDVNDDGLGDVISVSPDRLVLLVSRTSGGRR